MSCLDQLPDNHRSDLIRAVHQHNGFFWIGSGFSRNFGYPSWGAVLQATADELNYDGEVDSSQPLRAAELIAAHAALNGVEAQLATSDDITAYLRSLTGTQRDEAERYIRKAPPQIDTKVRRDIEAKLGWTAQENG